MAGGQLDSDGSHPSGAADNPQIAFRAALIYEYLWRTLDGS